MAKSGKPTLEQLKSFCDYDGTDYVSKVGEDYIEALGNVFSLDNRNDRPFTLDDIKSQPLLSDFHFAGVLDYKFICNLEARPMTINAKDKRTNEKILTKNFAGKEEEDIFKNALGCSYILTCVVEGKEHIIKIGSSRKTFKDRLQSYNCGYAYNWRTASTTNIKILQSMVATRGLFNLYLYDCSDEVYQITWNGVKSVKFASPKNLAVEDIMIKQFISQFGTKPLANVQADAEG